MAQIDIDFREYLAASGYDISQMGQPEESDDERSSLDHEKKPHHRVESFTTAT